MMVMMAVVMVMSVVVTVMMFGSLTRSKNSCHRISKFLN